MTELKTLKDIPMEQDKIYSLKDIKINKIDEDFRVAFNWKRAIKAEAVKWVRNWQEEKDKIKPEKGSGGHVKNQIRLKKRRLLEKIKCFKEFFNLTEEDLK